MGIFTLFVDHILLFHDHTDLDGKVAVITGANRGIGLATALALAKRGAHVVVTCRSLAKCQPVVGQIAKIGKGSARAAVLDLTSLESAANLAKELVTEYPQIHYFFANAGTTPRYELTLEGFEDGFGGMYLAHMAVALGILPSLERGAISAEDPSRIIVVSSEMAINAAMGIFGNKLIFSSPSSEHDLEDDWRGEVTRGDGTLGASLPAYGRAKLCAILFAFELNRRMKERGVPVIAHAVHTGAVVTASSRDSVVHAFPGWIPGLRWITGNVFFPLLWRSGQAGALALLCPALSHAEFIVQGGQYLDALCRPFLHDHDPNPTRDQETTIRIPQFLTGEQEVPLSIQIDPVQALLLADIRWSARLWNVSLEFLSASPAKHVVALAP
jgi:NAD(P)-dependent dehydrogenase (short-subunit alcohol dehydrogenase family)